jgi:putrescine aminotransferase
MVRGIRDSLVFCPPLIISHAEIDQMVTILRRSLDEAVPRLALI